MQLTENTNDRTAEGQKFLMSGGDPAFNERHDSDWESMDHDSRSPPEKVMFWLIKILWNLGYICNWGHWFQIWGHISPPWLIEGCSGLREWHMNFFQLSHGLYSYKHLYLYKGPHFCTWVCLSVCPPLVLKYSVRTWRLVLKCSFHSVQTLHLVLIY